jgi:hypothetical protein
MKVQVRKCRFTGKIFEEKDLKKYAIHLKKLRVELAEKRRVERTKKTFKAWLNKEKKNIHRPDDIPAWFLKNQKTIMDGANAGFGNSPFDSDKFFSSDEFTKFVFTSIRYNKNASNSHVHPDNGVGNWYGKDPSKPSGYKGWTGHVEGTLKRSKANSSSYPYGAALNAVGIKTGSGGGGNENWGYGITLFLDDWPGLKAAVDEMEKDEIVSKLKGVK